MRIYFNQTFDKKRVKALISWVLKTFGEEEALRVIEILKETGFQNATQAGISIGLHDLITPRQKASLVSKAQLRMKLTDQDFTGARITVTERSQRIIDTWHRASESLRKQVVDYFSMYDQFNPVYIMALSGARGNFSQVRQLIGMRGLMADQQGKIVSFPIRSNLREGLTLTEYFISCSGARKGLVDTALRTADTGYLTRRLVDVSHHVVVKRVRCHTSRGIVVHALRSYTKTLLPLKERLVGRVLAEDIYKSQNLQICTQGKASSEFEADLIRRNAKRKTLSESSLRLAKKDQEISPKLASKIALARGQVYIRSPLTCAFTDSVCQLCYGWSMSQGNLVPLGDAVGVIAAQSIGEPGTQLTMRTFHTGGVFSGDLLQEIRAPHAGQVKFSKAFQGLLIRTAQGRVAFLTKAAGELVVSNLTDTQLSPPKAKLCKADKVAFPVRKPLPLVVPPSLLKLKVQPAVASFAPFSTKATFLDRVAPFRKRAAYLTTKAKTLEAKTTPFQRAYLQMFRKTSQKALVAILKKEKVETLNTSAQKCNTFPIQTSTSIPFQALTMLFVRQGEKVEKNQLLAEFAIVTQEGNQAVRNRQTLFAELSGKVVEDRGGASKLQEIKEILPERTAFWDKSQEPEDDAFRFVEPNKSGRLGFFRILATRTLLQCFTASSFSTSRFTEQQLRFAASRLRCFARVGLTEGRASFNSSNPIRYADLSLRESLLSSSFALEQNRLPHLQSSSAFLISRNKLLTRRKRSESTPFFKQMRCSQSDSYTSLLKLKVARILSTNSTEKLINWKKYTHPEFLKNNRFYLETGAKYGDLVEQKEGKN